MTDTQKNWLITLAGCALYFAVPDFANAQDLTQVATNGWTWMHAIMVAFASIGVAIIFLAAWTGHHRSGGFILGVACLAGALKADVIARTLGLN